ncbi:MAG: SUMF1/EgtB/PvdO family nonheme iron enzyme [Anaerolineae bacterium]|nr:SUMF1/EgtB/PvdO family nonheme iron enzyme [Anaerolineae bacterium]
MSRLQDLEALIRESYRIVREYERLIATSNRPEEKTRARRMITEQRALIRGYLDECRGLAGGVLPDELAQIEVAMAAAPLSATAAGAGLEEEKVREQEMAAYLQVVLQQCGSAETRPYRRLSEQRGTPTCMSLLGDGARDGVYVPLRYDLHLSRAAAAQGKGRGIPFSPPVPSWAAAQAPADLAEQMEERDLAKLDIPLPEVLATPGHLVFIGAAGSGKTTILHLVAAVLAAQDETLAREWLGLEHEPFPVPVFVALRDFEGACLTEPARYRRDVESLLRFLDDHFQRWHPHRVSPGFLSGLVRGGRTWLLLDALDEVADFDHRVAVRQVIEQLAGVDVRTAVGSSAGNRLIVTARVAAYASANTRLDERFHVATVRDLTEAQWTPIVERLYAGFESDADVAAERARRLLARIAGEPLLREMVKTPLMAWTATLIHYADRELPEQRAELYNAYVDVLLGERLHEQESAEAARQLREDRWPMEDRRLYLCYAAYRAHEGAAGPGGEREQSGALVVIDEHDLVRRILAPFMAEYLGLPERQAQREAQAFVAAMAERSGLLTAHPGGYSLGDHLTVQEFLAANYLVDNVRGTEKWAPFLQAHSGESWWREVVLLVAGTLLQWPQQARRFLLEELGRLRGEDGDADGYAYGLAWAGQALLEIPPRRVGWHAGARDELAGRLARVLWQNPPQTAVRTRVEVGEVLGRLGDPRFSGALRLPEFVALPGGRFWMGSTEEEAARLAKEMRQERFQDELPHHLVEVGDMALARYPTTNAMYARFVEAGGYGDGRWWADGTVKDRLGTVRSEPAYWHDARFNGPNQPVVGVTWYEAVAYCRWLTAALGDGCVYRLPTEAEWERAAKGLFSSTDREGRYPWGEAWSASRANTEELGLGCTTPVGIFPDGGTAEGLLDMCGNVWEWCQDWYGEDAYRVRAGQVTKDPLGPPEGRYKVLRGGSWYTDRNLVRCACRVWNGPDDRHDRYGFRVARSLP